MPSDGIPLTAALKRSLEEVARKLVALKGPLSFYGVAKRPEARRWDLVLAAPWVRWDDRDTREEITVCLHACLSEDELLAVRGTFIVDPEEPLCDALTGTSEANGEWEELEEARLDELDMVEVHVLCSSGPVKPVPQKKTGAVVSRRRIATRLGGKKKRRPSAPRRSGRIGRRR